MTEDVFKNAQHRIARFQEEARQETLAALSRNSRRNTSEAALKLRQRLGFRLIYWGWQLAGNTGRTPEYLRELG